MTRAASIRRLGTLLLLAAAGAGRLDAQTDPQLVAAVREAQEGQSDSARTAVQRLLTNTPTRDSLYPQILYAAGIIANDAREMRRKFQQVAVEFPTSTWADDALLRLAQLDYAGHQLDAAARNLERIAVDFPQTDLLPLVAYWAGRTYFELNKAADACRWIANGIARSDKDMETKAQLSYLYQRCAVAAPVRDSSPQPAPVPADSAPPAPQPPSPPAPPAPATPAPAATHGRYRIQIAAVATTAAADAVARKAQAAGYQTVTVRESGFYKLRVGEFATRADAQRAVAEVKNKLGGSPFVVSIE